MNKIHRIATLARTVLVEAIEIPDGNPVRLRVEVFSWSDHEYTCQLYRMDTYRVRPTFLDADEDFVADEAFLVLDVGIEWKALRASTIDGLLNLLFAKIEWQLGWKIQRPAAAP
jgi:hypothetical protein